MLGVSVEYLVTGQSSSSAKTADKEQDQLKLYRKYHTLISKCEKLPTQKIDLLSQVAEGFEK